MQHELELLGDLSNETVDSAARKGRKLGFEQGFKQGLQQMLEQSIEQGRIEVISEFANWLIQRGFPDEEIQEITKLSPDEISKIRNGT